MDEVINKIELNMSSLTDVINNFLVEIENKNKIINDAKKNNNTLLKQLHDIKSKNIINKSDVTQYNYNRMKKPLETDITLNKPTKGLIKKYIKTIDRCIQYVQEDIKD